MPMLLIQVAQEANDTRKILNIFPSKPSITKLTSGKSGINDMWKNSSFNIE
jgi:hypothetical protein